ncbi:hypothetical protein HYPSUDRAFT_816685 [Hypholoma sublateritium FD-334 SS-4]|uniref:Nephrocystin 3-like N-terminal domain-containing protein n=1 Tax=Hypholoma sublateritium (strain FD-334 SS-4) TaxID=945553 RepID=A0A0D2NUV9_HYPSF|nr:hypothetical protein HYPSUDRAFT_816685 [Hypholoma sublateritium FD-334 SS-4]
MQQTKGKSQIGRGSNVFIQGREFVQDNELPNIHNCYDADDGFKHLKAHVAPAAYASWQEGDTPKCNPDTRTAILNTIMHWVAVATMGLQWILWLNGAAGAGKSVIARSVVDLCLKQQLVTARFFFFRTDPTRNTIKPIVPTLAYQLIQSIPALDSIITSKIQSHPLIFNESLDTQFEMLIFGPLRQLHKETPFEKAIVFLLDGVDECSGNDSQVSVIRTISEFVAEKSVPLLAIFSSRAESHLQMAFNSPRVDNILRRLALDTDYRTAGDIRLFLNVSFDAIKSTHPLKSSIIPKWPEPSLVEEIVDKSSGQFVYASVVIHFISSPRLNPVHQLEIIRGLRSVGDLTPLAQLDALYRHIFSQVHNITRVTAILAIVMLSGLPYRYHLCEILDITDDDIDVALADLTSIISNNRLGSRRRRKSSFSSDDDADIKFLHASLPDFLLDQSRSQQYFIDKGLWYAQLAVSYLNKRLI